MTKKFRDKRGRFAPREEPLQDVAVTDDYGHDWIVHPNGRAEPYWLPGIRPWEKKRAEGP